MPLRVMVVEDETLIALDLQSILEDEGHAVVGIASALPAAVRIAEANPHLDLAIMDIDLASEPDGVEVARRLRMEFNVSSLFVSARLSDEIRARALEWGPVGFIAKPFVRRDIVRAIAAMATDVATSD